MVPDLLFFYHFVLSGMTNKYLGISFTLVLDWQYTLSVLGEYAKSF